ncbi:MAG: flagellar hook-associated protein FlgK [Thioalkalivibrionaceae bacterium]
MSTFGIGVSALLTYQRALATTSQNVANVGNEDYSRQRVELEARRPEFFGSGYLGTGVEVTTVRRIQDDFVDAQLRNSTSNAAGARVRAGLAERLDRLLADPSTGLAPAIDRLFNAVQDIANDPTQSAPREVLLAEIESFARQLAAVNERLDEQRAVLNGQIGASIDEINAFSEGIARLNRDIVVAEGRGRPPNDLLDQRDALIRKLAEKVDVSTARQEDGSLNVFIGNGQPLVLGGQASQLVARPLTGDPLNVDVGFVNASSGRVVNVTRFLSGGELAALITTRSEVLDPAQNQLGMIGLALADTFNRQNELGLDLNGNFGPPLFELPDPVVRSNPNNSAMGLPTVTIEDTVALRSLDYELRFDGADYQLLTRPGGAVLASTPPGGAIEADGIRVDTTGLPAAVNDRWVIQPTRFAADGVKALTVAPERIAAAAAVRVALDPDNTGEASVARVGAIDVNDPNLLAPADVEFDGINFVVGAVSVPLDPSGRTVIEANGWRLEIQGTPAAGDRFTVGSNVGFPGDSRNFAALAERQLERLTNGGQASFGDAYNGLVTGVATRTRAAQVARDATAGLLDSARAQREEISGVNLDEEAANLLRFQQAYQAAAQVISISNQTFDALLAAVRR